MRGGDVCWIGGQPGNLWSDDANWNTGLQPSPGQDVILANVAGTITLTGVSPTFATLISAETLLISGAGTDLTVTSTARFNAPLTLDSAGALSLNGNANQMDTTTVTSGSIDSTNDLLIGTTLTAVAGILLGAGTTTIGSGASSLSD